jgi:hypothetical protein
MGCDAAHDYQPPCLNNIVDASQAVWKALGLCGDDYTNYSVITLCTFTWDQFDLACTSLLDKFVPRLDLSSR